MGKIRQGPVYKGRQLRKMDSGGGRGASIPQPITESERKPPQPPPATILEQRPPSAAAIQPPSSATIPSDSPSPQLRRSKRLQLVKQRITALVSSTKRLGRTALRNPKNVAKD